MNSKEKGFNLIELVIVMAIIGILAAIAYPSYTNSVRKSNRSEGHAALLRLADLQERFYLQNNSYAANLSDISTVANTEHDYYEMDVTAGDANSFSLTATAVTGGPQVNDMEGTVDCRVLSLNSAGQKTPADCWR